MLEMEVEDNEVEQDLWGMLLFVMIVCNSNVPK